MNKKERIELLCQLYAEVTSMGIINVGIVCKFKGWTFGTSHSCMSDLSGAGVLSRPARDNDEWLVIVPDYATAKQKITDYIDGRDVDPNDPSTWERRFLVHDISNRDEKPKMTVNMGEYPAFGEDVSGPKKCTGELRWLSKKVEGSVSVDLVNVLQQKWIKGDGSEEWIDVPEILEIGE